MPNKKQAEVKETPEYHNTYLLLKKYRDVVWNLELSVQRVRNKFRIEMGSSIEDFLESAYIAGLEDVYKRQVHRCMSYRRIG